jgi:iron complex outermembrane recepter protein
LHGFLSNLSLQCSKKKPLFAEAGKGMPGPAQLIVNGDGATAPLTRLAKGEGMKMASMKILKIGLLLAASAGAVGFSYPALAQETASDEGERSEIIVTALRREQRLQDVPTSVTALTGEDLARQQKTDLRELLRQAPGVGVDSLFGPLNVRVSIRGIGGSTTGDTGQIGIYNDEIVMTSSRLTNFPAFDLERVEVLRGPQGTLWGRNTTGGAINTVTRKASVADDVTGYAQASYGRFDQVQIQAGVSVPIIDDKLAIRVAGFHDGRGDWINNIFNDSKIGGYSDTAGRLSVQFKPTERVEIDAWIRGRDAEGSSIVYYNVASDPSGIDGYGTVALNDIFKVNFDTRPFYSTTHYGGGARIKVDLGSVDLITLTGYDDIKYSYGFDDDAGPSPVLKSRVPGDAQQFSQEVRLQSNTDSAFKWILGGYYLNLKEHVPIVAIGVQGGLFGTFGLVFDGTSKTENYAGFASGSYDLSDNWSILAGIRYSKDKVANTTQTLSFDPNFNADPLDPSTSTSPITASSIDNDRISSDAVTGDITLQYRPSREVNLFAKFARGYYGAGLNLNVDPSLRLIRPEKLNAFEVGAKLALLDNRLNLNLGAFYYDYNDIRVSTITIIGNNTAVSATQNAGKARPWGFDMDASLRATDFLTLRAGFSYTRSRYSGALTVSDPLDGSTVTENDARFPGTPEFTANAGAQVDVPVTDKLRMVFNTDWSYRSDSSFFVTQQNNALFRQGAYWLGNADIALLSSDDRFSIGMFVKNLADVRYRNFAFPAFFGQVQTAFGDPRTYGVRLSTRF